MCKRVFGYRLPEALSSAWLGKKRHMYLTNVALNKVSNPHPHDLQANRIFGGAPARLYSFLLGRGWKFLREQWRMASVQGVDVVTFPLPPRFYFLYPVLRLPFFLWRRSCRHFRKLMRSSHNGEIR